MTARWSVAGGAGVIVAGVLASYLIAPGTTRAGQAVFVQDVGQVRSRAHADEGAIVIADCTMNSQGLRVTGRIVWDEGPAVVVVSPGEEGGAGRAVGRAEAVSSSRFAGAAPGDFQITLGWATADSEFALVDAESLGPGPGSVRTGPTVRCPGAN